MKKILFLAFVVLVSKTYSQNTLSLSHTDVHSNEDFYLNISLSNIEYTRPADDKIGISLLTLSTPPVPIDTSSTYIITFCFNSNGDGGNSDLVWLQTDIASAYRQENYELGSWPNLDEQLLVWMDVTKEENTLPEYKLFQNYPNPFMPTKKIVFSLPEDAKVSIRIYKMLGGLIDEIVNKDYEQAIT